MRMAKRGWILVDGLGLPVVVAHVSPVAITSVRDQLGGLALVGLTWVGKSVTGDPASAGFILGRRCGVPLQGKEPRRSWVGARLVLSNCAMALVSGLRAWVILGGRGRGVLQAAALRLCHVCWRVDTAE